MLYLNSQVSERFGQLRWQVPTRVYARPLMLAPGVAMDVQTLKTELAAASYREDGGKRTGTYSHEGPEWVIASRGFRDVGGDVRSEEHTSELQSLMRISYAVFCLN